MNGKLMVYNTMSKEKEEFVPLKAGEVNMYVCGPTTYNYIHLGNARPIVVFDTVRRYLEYKGYRVNYIQNFTDVDDKIINRAKEENDEPLALAARYIEAFYEDVEALNVLPATKNPKVSEHIREIIDFVQGLIDKGYAYELEGDVYFAVRKDSEYGKLSGRDLDDLQAGARVEVDTRKHDPLDFALWKSAKEGEISWESPWGPGRPGWHIECSAMSLKYLGEQFDIHGGGQDLIFPHHENEVAQTECLTGKAMAKYWMHNGFITINKEKMSKSLNNFFLLRDILAKYDAQTVRFYLLSVHYRSPLDFADELLEMTEKGLERMCNSAKALHKAIATAQDQSTDEGKALVEKALAMQDAFETAMDDDFNTALAGAAFYDFVREVNIYLKQPILDKQAMQQAEEIWLKLANVMGLNLLYEAEGAQDELLEQVMELMIALRKEARAAKNYAMADDIRNRLGEIGIVLEDSPQGTTWKRK